MKIGIVAFGFTPNETGGTETYFRTLLEGLQKYGENHSFTLVVNQAYLQQAQALVKNKDWTVIGIESTPPLAVRLLRRLKLAYHLTNEQLIAAKINALNFDVVHFPFQIIYPDGIRAKKVLTFMDMQEKYYPEFFSEAELAAREKTFLPSVQKSDRVITISQFTKNDIQKYYGKKLSKKCRVIHISLSSELQQPRPKKMARPYFYYPAATWPHKNHLALVHAFAIFHDRHPEYDLVLTGMERQNESRLRALIRKKGLENYIRRVGYVPYDEVPEILCNAYALLFPSLFEGFGIPLLEAMHYNVPIVCSNSSSLPEVGGSAAIYFDPANVDQIVQSMTIIADDERLYRRLQKAGSTQIKKFSVQKMAAETINVYNEAYYEKNTK